MLARVQACASTPPPSRISAQLRGVCEAGWVASEDAFNVGGEHAGVAELGRRPSPYMRHTATTQR
jgi:hypothetical protein